MLCTLLMKCQNLRKLKLCGYVGTATMQDIVGFLPTNVSLTLKVLDLGDLLTQVPGDAGVEGKQLERASFKSLVDLRLSNVYGNTMDMLLKTVPANQLETLEIMDFGARVHDIKWPSLIHPVKLTRIYLPYTNDVWKNICSLTGIIQLGLSFFRVDYTDPTSMTSLKQDFLQSQQIRTLTLHSVLKQVLDCNEFWYENPWSKVRKPTRWPGKSCRCSHFNCRFQF